MRAHNLRWWLPVVILVVVVATWAAARWMTPVLPPLRIGINAWPGYEFLYLAQEKGFYRDAGVDVRLVEFNSLADARRAYERGQIDGLGATVIEVLQAREQPGRDLQVVAVVDYSDGADVVLARPEFTAPATLRGARIGVELGSLGVYVLVRALEHQQLSLADVKMVSLDQSAMEHAFAVGELDAVVTYPPVSLSLLKDGKAKPIFTSAQIPGEVVDVIAIDETVAQIRTDQVTRLLGAFQRAVAYTATNTTEAHRIMAAREGLSPADFAAALSDGIRLVEVARQAEFLRPGGTLTAVVDRVDQIMRASKQISGPDRRAGAFSDRFVGVGSVPP
jgi:NitT/TauT family transport system substrate-binding protein